jgi:hypothetical protein
VTTPILPTSCGHEEAEAKPAESVRLKRKSKFFRFKDKWFKHEIDPIIKK